jgi:hypothetical protein
LYIHSPSPRGCFQKNYGESNQIPNFVDLETEAWRTIFALGFTDRRKFKIIKKKKKKRNSARYENACL